MSHIQAAIDHLLAIWPNGKTCEHTGARAAFQALEAALEREKELVSALESMCHQYLRVEGGKLHHDFMSAGEAAFDALGWDYAGHPVGKEGLCEVDGCGERWACGMNGKDGKYHCLCSVHATCWIGAGNQETEEQAEARHVKMLRDIGMSEEQIEANRLFRLSLSDPNRAKGDVGQESPSDYKPMPGSAP